MARQQDFKKNQVSSDSPYLNPAKIATVKIAAQVYQELKKGGVSASIVKGSLLPSMSVTGVALN